MLSIGLHPHASRWWAELLPLVASIAAVVLLGLAVGGLWPHPHRVWVVLIGLAGIAAAGFGIMSAAAVQGDNLGVAGILHSKMLVVATVIPVLVVPSVLATIVLLIIYMTRRPQAVTNSVA